MSLLKDLLETLHGLQKAMEGDNKNKAEDGTRPAAGDQQGMRMDSDSEDDAELFGVVDDDAIQCDPVRRALGEIGDIILCLLRFSMTLRNPARHDQIKELAATSTHYYLKYDVDHVRNKFPDAQVYLHERLGKAVSGHRQYFKYRKEHHAKLAEGLDDEKEAEDGRPSTIATSLNAPNPPDIATPKHDELETESLYSATSFAPTTAEEVTLRPPPLPESGRQGGPFECPLCFGIVIAEDERSWRWVTSLPLLFRRPLVTLVVNLFAFLGNISTRISHHTSAHTRNVSQPISDTAEDELGNATRQRFTIATGYVLMAVQRTSVRELYFSSILSTHTIKVVLKLLNRDS